VVLPLVTLQIILAMKAIYIMYTPKLRAFERGHIFQMLSSTIRCLGCEDGVILFCVRAKPLLEPRGVD